MGPRLHSRVHAIPAASMGPRLASRGNAVFAAGNYGTNKLQWGRGSRAAETPEFLALKVSGGQLQWGRGSRAAETSAT